MTEHDPFRELTHVGEQLEAAFHAAGIVTWSQLATIDADELRAVASDVRPTSLEQIAHWQAGAAVRAETAGDAGTSPDARSRTDCIDDELDDTAEDRHHAFVVTIHVDEHGHALRSSVKAARTQLERSWVGWQPDELVDHLESEARLVDTTVRPSHSLPWIDVGAMLGGHRDVSLTIPADRLPSDGDLAYAARLMARPIGQRDGVLVAVCRGTAEADHDVPLEFGEIDLPTGVQKLTVGIDVTPIGH